MRETFVAATMLLLGLATPTAVLGQSISPSPVAPTIAQVQEVLEEVYEEFRDLQEGAPADYIPELAMVEPDLFGITVTGVEGQTLSIGDADHTFSIQSIAKVFTLALLMNDSGPGEVLDKLGVEPTGLPFNSVVAIEQQPTRVGNPLVNAGAIATTSLIEAPDADARYQRILDFYSAMAGEPLALMDDVYVSEAATNTRNQAIARLLQNYGRMYDDPAAAVDVYTKQGSIGVTTKQLAMMGATLAAGGVNPVTGDRVLDPDHIPELLAVMTMAGLYDYSGTWAFVAGIPSKSGVGGGILAVVPGKGAIAAFSPRLDAAGNSVRAQRAIAAFSQRLALNIYSPGSVGVQ